MKKLLSIAVVATSLAAMVPLSFADSSSSSSTSSAQSSSSSMSSWSSSSWSRSVVVPTTGACAGKTGLDLVNCTHNQSKMQNVKDDTTRKDKTIITHIETCKNVMGKSLAACVKNAIRKEIKNDTKATSAGTDEANESATSALKACAGKRGTRLAQCLQNLRKGSSSSASSM